jgi:hypothetical protein
MVLMSASSDSSDLYDTVHELVEAGVDINHIGNRHTRTALTLSHIRYVDVHTYEHLQ